MKVIFYWSTDPSQFSIWTFTSLFGIFIKLEFFHAQCSFRQDLFSGMWLSDLVILRILMHKQQSP